MKSILVYVFLLIRSILYLSNYGAGGITGMLRVIIVIISIAGIIFTISNSGKKTEQEVVEEEKDNNI